MRTRTAFTSATAPVAVIGSLALSLTATPAHAAEQPHTAISPKGLIAPTPTIAVDAIREVSRDKPRTHTVVRGDTVTAIAARHGLRTADVLAWNDLGWKSIIRPGDVLRLSAGDSSTPERSPVRASSRAKTSESTHGSSSSKASKSHTVARGDTLWAIARGAGVSLSALMRANDLTANSIIFPGEKLVIPSAKATERAASTARPAKTDSRSVTTKTRLDAEQIRAVKTIIAVGRDRGVSDKGIAIALATAMVESWLRNLDYGTYDSLGLFQQRPSMGWGTAAQVVDARRSAAAFFGGPRDPNGSATRGLLDIPGWRDMEFGAAAQAVQISAYPERYGQWESEAYAWLDIYG